MKDEAKFNPGAAVALTEEGMMGLGGEQGGYRWRPRRCLLPLPLLTTTQDLWLWSPL